MHIEPRHRGRDRRAGAGLDGSWSQQLLRGVGISIPVYAVKGYSITVKVADEGGAPVSTVMDESYTQTGTRPGLRPSGSSFS